MKVEGEMSFPIIPADTEEVVRSFQSDSPMHFVLKVESFSVLSGSNKEKYESDEFEACGFKWRLILYPNGDERMNVQNHISLYLSISDTSNFSVGWEVTANFTLFVYNNIVDKYLAFKGSAKRFHWLKTEWGFPELLELDYFHKSSNGFLFGESCAFGAEVSEITSVELKMQSLPKMQSLSFMKESIYKIFTWKIDNFSAIKDKFVQTPEFTSRDLQWFVKIYPKGNDNGEGNSMSLYLAVKQVPENFKVYAEYKLSIRHQVDTLLHQGLQRTNWLTSPDYCSGFDQFMLLSNVNNYLWKDTLVVEAEILVAAMLNKDYK